MKLNSETQHNFLKLVEELNELSLELIHAVNKVNKNNLGKISNEIKDVEKYLNILKKYLDSQF